MVLPDRGQAEAAILVGVLLASGTEETEVDQPDRGGQDPPSGQAVGIQVTPYDLAYGRQGGTEPPDPVMLVLIALLSPQIVVPVLAAARRVDAGGLDVALRIGTDPHVLPGRRDH
jgi:hypothetical protein